MHAALVASFSHESRKSNVLFIILKLSIVKQSHQNARKRHFKIMKFVYAHFFCYSSSMEITKKIILEWMEKNNHSREWLAKRCFVTERTVANWLTTQKRKIPKTQISTIAKLIEADSGKAQNLLITGLTVDEFKAMENQAKEENIGHVHDWAKKTLIQKLSKEDEGTEK